MIAEAEVGLNQEIFGFIQKMKENERLKLVKCYFSFKYHGFKNLFLQMAKKKRVDEKVEVVSVPLLGPKVKYKPQKIQEEDMSCAEVRG